MSWSQPTAKTLSQAASAIPLLDVALSKPSNICCRHALSSVFEKGCLIAGAACNGMQLWAQVQANAGIRAIACCPFGSTQIAAGAEQHRTWASPGLRSLPSTAMSERTPKYLPLPQPTSATTAPGSSDWMKARTLDAKRQKVDFVQYRNKKGLTKCKCLRQCG